MTELGTNADLARQFASKYALTVAQQLQLLCDYLDVVRYAPTLTFELFLERKAQYLDAPATLDVLNFYLPTKGDNSATPTQRLDALVLYVTYLGLAVPGEPLVSLGDLLVEDLKAAGKPIPEQKAKKSRKKVDKPAAGETAAEAVPAPVVLPTVQDLPPEEIHAMLAFTVDERNLALQLLCLDTQGDGELGRVYLTKNAVLPTGNKVFLSIVNGEPQPYIDIFMLNPASEVIAEAPPIVKHTHFQNGAFQLPTYVTVGGVNVAITWGE